MDLAYNLSHLYYFDLFNYLEKLPSLFITKFSLLFWAALIVLFFAFLSVCNLLIKLFEAKLVQLGNNKLLLNIGLALLLFLTIYSVDAINGSTVVEFGLKEKAIADLKILNKKKTNIGASLLKDIYSDFKLYKTGVKQVNEIPDFVNTNNDSSFSYKYFYHSNRNKEIIIVLESWGLLQNKYLRAFQLDPFNKIDRSKYEVKFDSSYFDGATVQAESRELLNKQGEAYFSVVNHNGLDIQGLVQKKVAQNYHTIAMQSFPGSYSLGEKFKKLIGFTQFKDYHFFHDSLNKEENHNNHYAAVNDEEVFKYIFEYANKYDKTFSYCLTINTHLPFALTYSEKQNLNFIKFKGLFKPMFPSEETLERYYRMSQELKCISELVNKNKIDKILIIGDHAPPFIFKQERKLFSSSLVPVILIEKK